jgi:uncharacterized protein (DUF2141 family)
MTMKSLLLAGGVLAIGASPVAAADTASLTINVTNVSDKGGDLRIGVYDQANFVVRGSKPVAGKIVSVTPGTMSVTIDGLTPGDYGAKILQDENRNGKMDTTMMVPTEPWGVSNNAAASLAGPPSWDAAKFTVKAGSNSIAVALH